MIKRIKQFFESVAYAGLKPSGGKPLVTAEAGRSGWLAPIQDRIERFLNKGGSTDPLYLSNRTFLQKARMWLIIGVPSVVLLGGLGLVLTGYFNQDAPVAPPPVGLSNAEIAQKMLPDLNKDLHIASQHDLDVQDVHIIRAGSVKLAGLALNNTDHAIKKVELVFELTDKYGSRQGAVSTELTNLAARSSVPFQFAIEEQAAAFALVREIHVE
ncbi:MAG: FxLYD domain-containing protein [Bryobacteraceae bacterium]